MGIKDVKSYISDYPKQVFFILGNEFCERFSYYGMKAILVIYLTRQLDFNEKDATSIYHAFNMVCYFTPLFGAMMADGWLGKYWVIFSISIVYAIGNAVMALTAFDKNKPGAFAGMALIALGTGGIKPCVSAFGGDQFLSHQEKQGQQFFSVFYMSINMGSLISTILTPILRTVKCYGKDCYPLAFGVPAILMIIAVVLFMIGTPWYIRIPPQGNVIGQMFKIICTAIGKKCGSKEKKEHWLDHAHPKYPERSIFDVKAVLRVLFMFIPLPVFWALFDQQGSRWTLQAGKMNGKIGNVRLLPDQIHAINPLLVIILVPIMESLIYPCLNKIRIPNRPLQRMAAGMFLAALAFVVSGIVQVAIDRTQPKGVPDMKSQIRFFNGGPCSVRVTVDGNFTQISSSQATTFFEVPANNYSFSIMSICKTYNRSIVINGTLEKKRRYRVLIAEKSGKPTANMFLHKLDARPIKGKAGISFLNAVNQTLSLKLKGTSGQAEQTFKNISSLKEANFKEMLAGDYNVFTGVLSNGTIVYEEKNSIGQVKTEQGGVYTVILQRDPSSSNPTKGEVKLTQHLDIKPNEIHMLWQIPQYFIITLGECLFSVTGLAFAYSQAPRSMKVVCQAAWNLTNAIGNLIVIIVAQAGGSNVDKAAELFFFAALMAATLIIFTIMAIFYKYVNFHEIEKQRDEEENKVKELANGVLDEKGHMNPEFIEVHEIGMKAEKVPGVPGYIHCMPPAQQNNYMNPAGPYRRHSESGTDNPGFAETTNL